MVCAARPLFASLFALAVLAACGGGSSSSSSSGGADDGGVDGSDGAAPPADAAPGDAGACEDQLAAATDKTCIVASGCALVTHFDCCGNVKVSVKAGTEAAYATAEAAYQTCRACGVRGCTHPDRAEDGTTPKTGQSIVSICSAGRCTSLVQ